MLAELKTLHAAMKEAVAVLRVELARSDPDAAALSAARLALSRVSGRRRAFVDCTILPLLHDVTAADARRIADFRRAASAAAISSSEHIARWPMRHILADWPGFKASAQAGMLALERRLADEETLFYPLLAGRQASSGT